MRLSSKLALGMGALFVLCLLQSLAWYSGRSDAGQGEKLPAWRESAPTPGEFDLRRQWVQKHLSGGSDFFAFMIGAGSSRDILGKAERESRPLDAARIRHTIKFPDANGLSVRVEAVEYLDFPTVEYTLWIRNAGTKDSLPVSDVQPVDLSVDISPAHPIVVHAWEGSQYTVNDFRPFDVETAVGFKRTFASKRGRPTEAMMPTFNIDGNAEGTIVSLGWPGSWTMDMDQDTPRLFRVHGGHNRWNLVLRPGEEIRTGLVVLQFWKGGDWIRSQNVWRRWMLKHCTPTWFGKPLTPIARTSMDDWFPGMLSNGDKMMEYMKDYVREKVDFDCWVIDAGWFPSPSGSWGEGVGSWEPDPVRYPKGIRPLSDYIHANGHKFSMWFEPERVYPGSRLYKEHPEWLLGAKGGNRLLDLGNDEARSWLTNHLDKCFKDWGVDCYRQDFNFDPLPYWNRGDDADRVGITEIRHVMGYLKLWDELLRRNPNLLIDTCASGGRRLDVETLRRSFAPCRTDYAGRPNAAQCHTYGITFLVPFNGTCGGPGDDYGQRSGMCQPSFRFAVDGRLRGEELSRAFERLRHVVREFRSISDNFLGDYYPLAPYSQQPDVWMAFQFDRPEQNAGVVMIFRREKNEEESKTLRLRGLDPQAQYEMLDVDSQRAWTQTGSSLMTEGLSVKLSEKPRSAIVQYHKAE